MCCAERDGNLDDLFGNRPAIFEKTDTDSVQSASSRAPPTFFVPMHLQMYGDVASRDLQQLVNCVQCLYRERRGYFLRSPQVFSLYEAEWIAFLSNARKLLQGGELWCFRESALLYCDHQLVGGPEHAMDWMTDTFNVSFNLEDLERSGIIYAETLLSRKRSVVYLDVAHDGHAVGRLVFELHDELLPRTCEFFRRLCDGEQGVSAAGTLLWYAGTPVHRVVRGGWLQAGDIVDGCGAHGASVSAARLADECFAVPHDRRGRLSLVQDSRNTNSSQFMVAFQPMTYMQGMSCAFGQLIEGSTVLDYLETVDTNNERPIKPVAFSNAGLLHVPDQSKTPSAQAREQLSTDESSVVLSLPIHTQESSADSIWTTSSLELKLVSSEKAEAGPSVGDE